MPDADTIGKALTGLNRGPKFLPSDTSCDFTLRELVEDWYLLRYGPFTYDKDRQITRIFETVAKSLE